MKQKYFFLIFALFLLCSCGKEEKLYGEIHIDYDNTAYIVEDGVVIKKQDYTITFPSSGDMIQILFFVEDNEDKLGVFFLQEKGKEWLGYKDFINHYANNPWERETLLYTDESGEKREVTGIVYPVSIYTTENNSTKDRSVVCYYQVADIELFTPGGCATWHPITIIQKGKGLSRAH